MSLIIAFLLFIFFCFVLFLFCFVVVVVVLEGMYLIQLVNIVLL